MPSQESSCWLKKLCLRRVHKGHTSGAKPRSRRRMLSEADQDKAAQEAAAAAVTAAEQAAMDLLEGEQQAAEAAAEENRARLARRQQSKRVSCSGLQSLWKSWRQACAKLKTMRYQNMFWLHMRA